MAKIKICNKCGLEMSPIRSQTSNKIIGHICDNGHTSFTTYGQHLLNTPLKGENSCEDSDATPKNRCLLHQH